MDTQEVLEEHIDIQTVAVDYFQEVQVVRQIEFGEHAEFEACRRMEAPGERACGGVHKDTVLDERVHPFIKVSFDITAYPRIGLLGEFMFPVIHHPRQIVRGQEIGLTDDMVHVIESYIESYISSYIESYISSRKRFGDPQREHDGLAAGGIGEHGLAVRHVIHDLYHGVRIRGGVLSEQVIMDGRREIRVFAVEEVVEQRAMTRHFNLDRRQGMGKSPEDLGGPEEDFFAMDLIVGGVDVGFARETPCEVVGLVQEPTRPPCQLEEQSHYTETGPGHPMVARRDGNFLFHFCIVVIIRKPTRY